MVLDQHHLTLNFLDNYSAVVENQIGCSKLCDSMEDLPEKLDASKGRCGNTCPANELVGCKIKVWWPLDEMFYEGNVASFDPSIKMHQVDYDDGDRQILDLTKECWKLIGYDNFSSHAGAEDSYSSWCLNRDINYSWKEISWLFKKEIGGKRCQKMRVGWPKDKSLVVIGQDVL